MKAQRIPELGIDVTTLPLKDQREVNTLREWRETDEKAAERSRRLRNMLGGTALAGYGVLAAIHYGESVPLSDLGAFSAGFGVLMNSATRKHDTAKLNEKMADRSAVQVANITEHVNLDESDEIVKVENHDDKLALAA